jgi:mannose-1-phosphate guanylyltransferase
MEKAYGVIMAGGVGSRFWPKSRKAFPKQYLHLLGNETMIQAVANRLLGLMPSDRIMVISTRDQQSHLASQLSWLPSTNLIYEPFGKNTAPCIGLCALHIHRQDPNALMIIMPADHLIANTEKFHQVLHSATQVVHEYGDALVTIGIEPTYPATGYGYIQRGEAIRVKKGKAFKVRAFAEKPTLEIAQQFYLSGEFLWNSGIFIWRAETILHYFEELMPELYEGLMAIKKAYDRPDFESVIEKIYKQIRSESIDYGIMEHASKVFVIEGNFGWSDVGSWEEVYNISEKDDAGNVVKGNPILKDVRNSYIEVGDRLVALVGVEDVIVVDTNDAILICKRNQSQDVKWVVEKVKHSGLQQHL